MKLDIYARLAIVLGVIWSVLGFLFIYSAFSSGRNAFGDLMAIQWASLALYLFLAGAFFRLVYSHYWFAFKNAFRYTLIIGLTGNVLFFLITYLFLQFNWDVLGNLYITDMLESMQAAWDSGEMEKFGEVNPEGFERKKEEMRQVTPFTILFYDFTIKTFITLIISLIIAVVLRTSKPVQHER